MKHNVQFVKIWKLVMLCTDGSWVPSIDHSGDFRTKEAGRKYIRRNLKGLRANGTRYKLELFTAVVAQ